MFVYNREKQQKSTVYKTSPVTDLIQLRLTVLPRELTPLKLDWEQSLFSPLIFTNSISYNTFV